MKIKTLLILTFLATQFNSYSQDQDLNEESFYGTYYSLNPRELRSVENVDQRTCSLSNVNNKTYLSIVSNKKHIKETYQHKIKTSITGNKSIFFNEKGTLIIEYDKKSFIRVQPTASNPRIDFYSKSKDLISSISKKEIFNYAIKWIRKI